MHGGSSGGIPGGGGLGEGNGLGLGEGDGLGEGLGLGLGEGDGPLGMGASPLFVGRLDLLEMCKYVSLSPFQTIILSLCLLAVKGATVRNLSVSCWHSGHLANHSVQCSCGRVRTVAGSVGTISPS